MLLHGTFRFSKSVIDDIRTAANVVDDCKSRFYSVWIRRDSKRRNNCKLLILSFIEYSIWMVNGLYFKLFNPGQIDQSGASFERGWGPSPIPPRKLK